ncbi:YHS domain-containing (seleno)protein [Phyllobacterium lublinensis]|uniref:YHS domain-containing (seleno)protein n=1 Tax=Phyllobacterium lublinensis TaxID=2875708 RepID=UPI001CCF1B8E|nr:YHS domain-containing (seleno)protein [Phyllobacterium sp. 2063]MBZ9657274.1 YHS domain-containing protein [Phyllobacterium sp. 2063]
MSDNKVKRGMGLAAAIGATALLVSFVQPSIAEEMVNTGYFGDVAIKGYDPVAYFTQSQAVEGSDQFSYRWLGATWHFASAENLELFKADPAKYAPQYGGYCADGVSFGTVTTNVDPKAWRIIDGKLYISYDPGAADGFEKNPTKLVDSKKHWSEVQQTLVSEKVEKDWQAPSN